MSDLIKKEDAIEAVKKLWIKDETDTNKRQYNIALQHCISVIRNTTSTDDNWIPVSERLPKKEEKTYWVFLDSGGQCECRWTNDVFGLGSNEWSDWGWKILDKPQYTTVIAWRPLPTPYKGE